MASIPQIVFFVLSATFAFIVVSHPVPPPPPLNIPGYSHSPPSSSSNPSTSSSKLDNDIRASAATLITNYRPDTAATYGHARDEVVRETTAPVMDAHTARRDDPLERALVDAARRAIAGATVQPERSLTAQGKSEHPSKEVPHHREGASVSYAKEKDSTSEKKSKSRLSIFSVLHPALHAAFTADRPSDRPTPSAEPLTNLEYRSSPLRGTEARDRTAIGLPTVAKFPQQAASHPSEPPLSSQSALLSKSVSREAARAQREAFVEGKGRDVAARSSRHDMRRYRKNGSGGGGGHIRNGGEGRSNDHGGTESDDDIHGLSRDERDAYANTINGLFSPRPALPYTHGLNANGGDEEGLPSPAQSTPTSKQRSSSFRGNVGKYTDDITGGKTMPPSVLREDSGRGGHTHASAMLMDKRQDAAEDGGESYPMTPANSDRDGVQGTTAPTNAFESLESMWNRLVSTVKRTLDNILIPTPSVTPPSANAILQRALGVLPGNGRPSTETTPTNDGHYSEQDVTNLVNDIMHEIQLHHDELRAHRDMLQRTGRWDPDDLTERERERGLGSIHQHAPMLVMRTSVLVPPDVLVDAVTSSTKKLLLSRQTPMPWSAASRLLMDVHTRLADIFEPADAAMASPPTAKMDRDGGAVPRQHVPADEARLEEGDEGRMGEGVERGLSRVAMRRNDEAVTVDGDDMARKGKTSKRDVASYAAQAQSEARVEAARRDAHERLQNIVTRVQSRLATSPENTVDKTGAHTLRAENLH